MRKTKARGKVFCMQLKGKQKFLRLFGDSSKEKGLRSGFVVLRPKESVGLHNTRLSEEVIFIIDGSGLICYGRENSFKVKKNTFVYIPPKIPHNIINTGKNLLKYVYTVARA